MNNQKNKIDNIDNKIYKILSENILVKENLDKYLIDQNKKRLTFDESKNLLFEFCNDCDRTPINKEQFRNYNIGTWLSHQKQKIDNIDNKIYKILSENIIVKENLDCFLIYKNENKNKEKLTFDESKKLLFDFCNEYNKTPSAKEQFKNCKIGGWLSNQKNKIDNIDNKIYKILSENIIVKENLDKYLDNKNKKLTFDESKNLLFEFCKEYNKTPIHNEQFRNYNIGKWFQNQKEKIDNIDNNIYKILAEDICVKKNLNKYLDNKKL
jgi:hypothetical protein